MEPGSGLWIHAKGHVAACEHQLAHKHLPCRARWHPRLQRVLHYPWARGQRATTRLPTTSTTWACRRPWHCAVSCDAFQCGGVLSGGGKGGGASWCIRVLYSVGVRRPNVSGSSVSSCTGGCGEFGSNHGARAHGPAHGSWRCIGDAIAAGLARECTVDTTATAPAAYRQRAAASKHRAHGRRAAGCSELDRA